MRFIPTRVHGILDYASATVQLTTPWLLATGENSRRMEVLLPVGLGIGVLGYSVLTAYELGVVRVLPMPVHLGLDMLVASLLLTVPWLTGFSSRARAAYTAIALAEWGVILASQTTPSPTTPTATSR